MKKLIYGALLVAGLGFGLTSCNDDDVTYNGDLIEYDASLPTTFTLAGNNAVDTLKFASRALWKLEFENPADEDWLTVSPKSGSGGYVNVIMKAKDNATGRARQANFTITALGQQKSFSAYQEAADVVILDEKDVPNYDRFFVNSEHGKNILRSDAKFNFHNYAESEHFFVFWDSYFFGNDPGDPSLGDSAVDINDLLEKAEKFFNTNITVLGMADLGQGKSYLDQYKMQIYILDPTPEWWVATGSGYDNTIGALWVTPSTMHPVGSTIGHEIGHSFQYQVYADKLYQGESNDFESGFRYNPWGGTGCGYWEQCAQWQSYIDYPDEQFTTYNYSEWLNNHHRHFHHEWMRYASYWLQTYWVEKHGIEAFANIWKNSKYPEDAIEAYTRLYNDGDWDKTRDELIDYAMKMATFDMETLPVIKKNYVKGQYKVNLLKNDNGEFQVAYSSCPGATGFNVIELNVPQNGGKVTVNFRGLAYGAPLLSSDPGVATISGGTAMMNTYNKSMDGSSNTMGWRYGFVAYANGKRTYSEIGKDNEGSLSFDVPSGTEILYLVVQGSPTEYIGCGWDEDERTDAQFPYAVSFEGTDYANYVEPVTATYKEENGQLVGELTLSVNSSLSEWVIDQYNIADQEVADFFGVARNDISKLMVQPVVGQKQEAEEGKIVVFNEESDGTLSNMPTANVGYWVNKEGNAVNWGNGQIVYYEINGSVMDLGQMAPDAAKLGTVTMRPVFVYTNNGVEKVLKYNVTYNYK